MTTRSHRHAARALVLCALAIGAQAAGATPADGFGVAAAVRGDVTVTPAGGGAPQPLRGGEVVSPGDRIHTGPGAALQVLLTDETVFSLGEDTRFQLERYSYDAADADGEIHASVARGAFKVTSGRIGEAHPDRITVDLPSGTVSLRGTVVAGYAGPEGDTVGLVGPGARRESLEKKGSFVFIPKKGAAVRTAEDEILVYRAGYAVTVNADGEVSEPFEMSGREFGQLVASLVGYRRGGDDGPPPSRRARYGADDDPEDASEPYHGRKHRQRRRHTDDDDDDYLAKLDDDDYDDKDHYAEDRDEDDRTRRQQDLVGRILEDDDFVQGLPYTKLADLNDVQNREGRYAESGLRMEEGGTFDFRFEFGTAAPGELDYVGFENIQTEDVASGELSWDVAVDGAPIFERLDLRSEDGTLINKADCVGVCEGRIRIRNAGNGAVAKFFRLRLETEEDKFDERLVRPGGNNNFP